jgi:hypothetical protein
VPFTVFRWPLAGGLLAMAADGVDVIILQGSGYGFLAGHYHDADKALDTWYYTLELVVVWRWRNKLVRRTGQLLYVWRLIGLAVFMATDYRPAFVFAPNIFENYYLVALAARRVFPRAPVTWKRLALVLLVAGVPKVAQEYLMHYRYVGETWNFFRDHLFWWLYN